MIEEQLFHQALELPADQRSPFLQAACAENRELRQRVEALLQAHANPGSFMQAPPPAGSATLDQSVLERPGTQIGPYKLLQQIGEGGMGTVYMAEQSHPVQRKVALKVIKAGMDSGQVIARFEAERQALALMDHPNIAKVLDAGTTAAGRPYFVMELVKGVPITTYCDENHLPPKARLELFTQVCQAVQHAHQKGVIHRDIKPTNVLVTLYDDKPVPKVIDFGVAKATGGRLTERTMFTGYGQIVGTIEYMSPEQARLNALDIDTRGDIYSLGVLLYELLTGTTPFDKKRLRDAAFDEMLRMIREEEPPKPSTRLSTAEGRASIAANRSMEPNKLSGLVRGELDWIVMKALEKDRNRRYETANGFAADVLRYLADEPVLACPPSTAYRFRKFARRHKTATAFAALSLVALLSVVGVVVGLIYNARLQVEITEKEFQREKADRHASIAESERLRAEEESRRATQQEALAHDLKYDAQVNLAHRAWQDNQVDLMVGFLEQERPRQTGQADLRSFEWHYLWRLCHSNLKTLSAHSDRVISLCYSPDGKQLATASQDKTVKIWDVATGNVIHTLSGHSHFALAVAYSPNGKWLASGSADTTVKLWEVATGQETRTLTGHPGGVRCLVFSPDHKRLASADQNGYGKIWELPAGRELHTITGTAGAMRALDFSPDGNQLVSASHGGAVAIWDGTGKLLRSISQPGAVFDVAFSPDGKSLASAHDDGTLRLWDAVTGMALRTIQGHSYVVFSVEFSRDGKRLVSASWDQTVKVWDIAAGDLMATLKGHAGYVYGAAFRPDGKQIASCGWDGTVKLWDLTSSPENIALKPHTGPVRSVSFSPDANRLASTGDDGSVKISDVRTGRVTHTLRKHAGPVNSVAFSPDGQLLASAGSDRTVRIWDVHEGKELRSLTGHTAPVVQAVFSPDGVRLATASFERRSLGQVKLWQVQTGQEILALKGGPHWVYSVAFSPDGKKLAAAGRRGAALAQLMIWDTTNGSLPQGPNSMPGLAQLMIWDTTNGLEPILRNESSQPQQFYSVAFSRDGRSLFTGGYDNSVMAWDSETGEHLFTLKGHSAGVINIVVSPDGKRLISSSGDITNNGVFAETIVWNLLTRQQVLTLKGHKDAILGLALDANGRHLATASRDGLIKIWDAREPTDADPNRTPSARGGFGGRPSTADREERAQLLLRQASHGPLAIGRERRGPQMVRPGGRMDGQKPVPVRATSPLPGGGREAAGTREEDELTTETERRKLQREAGKT